MDSSSIDFPHQFESERLTLRSYKPGDGKWYYAMSLRNREHLKRYEADNVAANIPSENAAEDLVRELSDAWAKRAYFFIGAFEKQTHQFVAQIYVGPMDWKLPEFQIGYFADVDHEGKGFVTEAVNATLGILFNPLGAHRVSLKCDVTNTRSFRVAERCHMTREGCLRENRRNPDGTYSSSFIYGLLRSEFTGLGKDQGIQFSLEMPQEGDREQIATLLTEHWGSRMVVSRGKITDAVQLPRIVARAPDGRLVGLLTHLIDRADQSCELVSINSEIEGRGIATKLLEMMEAKAKENGCRRIWLITTNDNPEAAAFYVKRGFRLVKVHLNALELSRTLKPQIPLVGKHGIILADEWEFEKLL